MRKVTLRHPDGAETRRVSAPCRLDDEPVATLIVGLDRGEEHHREFERRPRAHRLRRRRQRRCRDWRGTARGRDACCGRHRS